VKEYYGRCPPHTGTPIQAHCIIPPELPSKPSPYPTSNPTLHTPSSTPQKKSFVLTSKHTHNYFPLTHLTASNFMYQHKCSKTRKKSNRSIHSLSHYQFQVNDTADKTCNIKYLIACSEKYGVFKFQINGTAQKWVDNIYGNTGQYSVTCYLVINEFHINNLPSENIRCEIICELFNTSMTYVLQP
jgi:hypothetical protein